MRCCFRKQHERPTQFLPYPCTPVAVTRCRVSVIRRERCHPCRVTRVVSPASGQPCRVKLGLRMLRIDAYRDAIRVLLYCCITCESSRAGHSPHDHTHHEYSYCTRTAHVRSYCSTYVLELQNCSMQCLCARKNAYDSPRPISDGAPRSPPFRLVSSETLLEGSEMVRQVTQDYTHGRGLGHGRWRGRTTM